MAELDSEVSRRRFVGMASGVAGACIVAFPQLSFAQEPALRETADLITGPFYPLGKPADRDADLTWVRGHRSRAKGQVIRLSGRVMDIKGQPVPNALIEVWQANALGRYSHPSDPNIRMPLDPDFQGYARLQTDHAGRYSMTTIKPGAYPTPRGDMRAPHIHFLVDGRKDRKVTQLFFPDEPLNDQDRHLRSVRRPETLIAQIDDRGGSELVARWDIVLTLG